MADMVNNPPHYVDSSITIEPIELLMYLDFCTGNALKYVIRAGKKGDRLEDLKKAQWYLNKSLSAPQLKLEERDANFLDTFFKIFITHSKNKIIQTVAKKGRSMDTFMYNLRLEIKSIIKASEEEQVQ